MTEHLKKFAEFLSAQDKEAWMEISNMEKDELKRVLETLIARGDLRHRVHVGGTDQGVERGQQQAVGADERIFIRRREKE